MRRADRLFQLVQLLRSRRFSTAATLADRLEVSERTIYRDVADLARSGVPIVGEAGVGYRLDKAFELPPLMFNTQEIQALVLGARMVQGWADPELRQSARSILEKVHAMLPERERAVLHDTALYAGPFNPPKAAIKHLRGLREAVLQRRKVRVNYADTSNRRTRRVLRPLGLFFWGATWTLAAYCELREDFRNFRIDRIQRLTLLEEPFRLEPPVTLDDFARAMTTDH